MEATMKAAAPIKLLTALFIFGLGLATGLVAQTSSDSPNRTEQKRTDLTGAPGKLATVLKVTQHQYVYTKPSYHELRLKRGGFYVLVMVVAHQVSLSNQESPLRIVVNMAALRFLFAHSYNVVI